MRIEDVNISPHIGLDQCGRVFFYQGRVLRAINPQAEQRVHEFLESELYTKLVENSWFIKTWIIDDVQLDGYPLIVESEKVYACQWQLLTFKQLKDSAILAIKINSLCKQYGWVLCDDWFNNFGQKDGQIVYFDLGGFLKKGERTELIDVTINWKVLRLMSLGLSTLAKSTSPWLDAAYNAFLLPNVHSILDEFLEILYHPSGWKYYVYRKKSKPAIFSIRSQFAHVLINSINRLAARFTQKPYPWRLLYVEPAFELSEQEFESLSPYYQGHADIEYLGNDVITCLISQISSLDSQPKSIMLYGEFCIEDIELLRQVYKGGIWVCSPLLPYTDHLFKEISERRINVGVLSYNFCFNTIHDNEKIIELDIDCLLCHSSSITGISESTEPSYFLSKLANYFNQAYIESNGICEKYVKFNKVFIKN